MNEKQLEFEDLLIRKALERELREKPAEPEPVGSGFRFLHALKRLAQGREKSARNPAGGPPRA